jgi:hypothetical protein
MAIGLETGSAAGDTLVLSGYIAIAHKLLYRCSGSPNPMTGGHHEFICRRSSRAKASSDRAFGLVFAALFGVLAIASARYVKQSWPWYAAISGGFLIISWLRPTFMAPLNRVWTGFGILLGHVVTPVVMGTLFFLVVTPVAWLARRLGKDFLRLGRDPGAESYWIERDPPGPASTSMRDQF